MSNITVFPVLREFLNEHGCYPIQLFIKELDIKRVFFNLKQDGYTIINKSGIFQNLQKFEDPNDSTDLGVDEESDVNFWGAHPRKTYQTIANPLQIDELNMISYNTENWNTEKSFYYLLESPSIHGLKYWVLLSQYNNESNVVILYPKYNKHDYYNQENTFLYEAKAKSLTLDEINSIIENACNSVAKVLINHFTIVKEETKEPVISLLNMEHGRFYTTEHKIAQYEIDLESNYGKNFLPIDKKIQEFLLQENGSGLCLLHGKPGCGKTFYIRKLLSDLVESGKEVLYLPSSYVGALADPQFVPFLLTKKNSILIIEDAEMALRSRDDYGNSQSVSNLLNLSDGCLGDIFNIKILCTFNTDKDNLDQALLRKGRLSVIYEFNPLSIEESNNLLAKLGKPLQNKSLSLAEIYNLEVDNGVKVKEERKFGFAQ